MKRISILAVSLLLVCLSAQAREPVFSLGPHTIYKGGVELGLEYYQYQQDTQQVRKTALGIDYGFTSNWSLSMAIPFVETEGDESQSGWSDALLVTKYRLMRKDGLATQTAAAILFGASLKNGKSGKQIDINNDAVDSFLAVTYGHDTRSLYRWAGARYWRFGKSDDGLQLGSAWYFDYAWGHRLTLNDYTSQDWIALFEMNAEFRNRNELGGEKQRDSGGTTLFASPGISWSYHNWSVKGGVQIPVFSNLHENQDSSENRIKVLLQWRI